jgi:hypothetical protein
MAILQSSIVSGNLNVTGSLTVTGSSVFNNILSGTTGRFSVISCSVFSPPISASPAGATNQVQFNSGNVFTADPNFVWDNTNDRLGIGTSSPGNKLDVKGSGEIVRLESTSATGSNYLRFKGSSANLGYIGYGSAVNNHLNIANEAGDIALITNNLERVKIDSSGNVGIGTTNPAALLHVNGRAVALNFSDTAGAYNVNLGNGGTEGRGLVAGYAGNGYPGIGYNIRHTTTGSTYVLPLADTSNYLLFSQGFQFMGAATGTVGRTSSLTELMRINNAGNVGIGTTNPTARLDVNGDANITGSLSIITTGSKNAILNLKAGLDNYGGQINITNPNTSSIGTLDINIHGDLVSQLKYDNVDTTLNLITADDPTLGPSISLRSSAGQLFRIQSSDSGLSFFNQSDTSVLLVDQTGDIIMNSGRGINFTATGQATGFTSELFDDYEEGTWTPAFSGSTGAGSFNYVVGSSGTYTKIGNMVYISGFVDISSIIVAGSGNIRITGLPFNVANTQGNQFHINIAWTGVTLSINKILGFAADAGSWIDVFRTTGAVTNSLSTAMTMAELGTGGFRFSGFYRVA